jgi:hypothetical protein
VFPKSQRPAVYSHDSFWPLPTTRTVPSRLLLSFCRVGVRFFSLKSFEWKIPCDMANSKAGTALNRPVELLQGVDARVEWELGVEDGGADGELLEQELEAVARVCAVDEEEALALQHACHGGGLAHI